MLRCLLLVWLLVCWEIKQPLCANELISVQVDTPVLEKKAVGCMTTGETGAITLFHVPSRLIGVAPLSVFFDATGTSSTKTIRPFHDLEYRWDFGDSVGSPVSGTTWRMGNKGGRSSRNLASGAMAAHVFETPGIYTVTLSVTDGIKTVTNNCARIIVQHPDTVFPAKNTICIGAASVPVAGEGGCPSGASAIQQSNFATAISKYALTGKRVLFKRGDTFSATTSASIIRTGPGIVGAFGSTGGNPVVQMTGNDSILNLSSRRTPNISDWRIMDLDLDGMSMSSSVGVAAVGGIKQITLIRLKIHNAHTGISFSNAILDYQNSHGYPGHDMWDQLALIDSTILHTIGGGGGGGVGVAANRFSMLGNFVDDTMLTEHVLRVFHLNKGVISNNTLSRQAPLKAIIKMHAESWCAPGSLIDDNGKCTTASANYLTATPPVSVAGPYTEQVIIADNKLIAADGTDWTVNTGPQNAQSDERIRNIIIERNWFVAGNATQAALVVNAADVTIRNNICDMGKGSGGTCIEASLRGRDSPEPPPTDIRVYNNTFYSASSGDFDFIRLDRSARNVSVRNNIGYAPYTKHPTIINGTGASGLIHSNNSTNSQIKNTTPGWVHNKPVSPGNFTLPIGSYGKGAGLAGISVFSDFFNSRRPQGRIDMGAIEGD